MFFPLILPHPSLDDVENRLRKVEAQLQRETHANPSPITRTGRGSTISVSPLGGQVLDADFWDPPAGEGEQTPSPTYLDTGNTVAPDALPMPTVDRALAIWVQKYQPWFPILHPASLGNSSGSVNSRYALPRKAVTAVVVLDEEGLRHWERSTAAKVVRDAVLEGFTVSSLQTVQALLIISNHYYANGNLTEFWNTLAICKK